ncbi:MAG: hypothetical protein JCHSAcid_09730 [uncultured Acidilobus sp. JCHS]|jgi:hypothetical protein|nr:MAG: hypothetical protein JCHSAcid_09730 [uncultured Acidilobus sp. JCHS]
MDRVIFVRKPPKGRSGKILRPILRAVLRQGLLGTSQPLTTRLPSRRRGSS